jgi:hypothetical protein
MDFITYYKISAKIIQNLIIFQQVSVIFFNEKIYEIQ